ncbi:hypothetical protein STEG23_011537, partial [Scotinomys teguina]
SWSLYSHPSECKHSALMGLHVDPGESGSFISHHENALGNPNRREIIFKALTLESACAVLHTCTAQDQKEYCKDRKHMGFDCDPGVDFDSPGDENMGESGADAPAPNPSFTTEQQKAASSILFSAFLFPEFSLSAHPTYTCTQLLANQCFIKPVYNSIVPQHFIMNILVEKRNKSYYQMKHPAPTKVDAKRKKAAGKDKSSDKKVQTKGKKGAKGKQAEVADQQTTDVPVENGQTENQSPASEGEEREAKAD